MCEIQSDMMLSSFGLIYVQCLVCFSTKKKDEHIVPEMSKMFCYIFMADQNTLNDATYISSGSMHTN